MRKKHHRAGARGLRNTKFQIFKKVPRLEIAVLRESLSKRPFDTLLSFWIVSRMVKKPWQEYNLRVVESMSHSDAMWENSSLIRVTIGSDDTVCQNELCNTTVFPCMKLLIKSSKIFYDRYDEQVLRMLDFKEDSTLTMIWSGTIQNALDEGRKRRECLATGIYRFGFVLDAVFKSLTYTM